MAIFTRSAALPLLLLAVALAGCSATPFRVEGSEASVEAAAAQGQFMLPRLKPYALGICYSSAGNDLSEVEAEALYLCDGGVVVKVDEDAFWNGCSLTQPERISYVCYPPDKTKRVN
jgi:hypothetical protein